MGEVRLTTTVIHCLKPKYILASLWKLDPHVQLWVWFKLSENAVRYEQNEKETIDEFIICTLVHTILTATFHSADASDPGWTSKRRCFGWPTASLAVLIVKRK